MPVDAPLFSRDDLTRGLPSRRATAVLFAIENRSAQLVAGSQQALPIVLSEAAVGRERAFLEALARGRDLPVTPTIRDMEHHAAAWADLVPPDPGTRAALAQLIAGKYAPPYPAIPRIRATLALDAPETVVAYQGLFGGTPQAAFRQRLSVGERLRWGGAAFSARMDALPAFWLAFVLSLIIGAVNLALPIAVAGVGALPGVVVIVFLGVINLVTITAMVEVVSRSGGLRFGDAFIGTLVRDHLGPAASAILTAVLVAFSFGILLVFYVGISTTLADATGLPAPAWMIGLFGVGLYFLSRGSLNATVASSIVITAVNVGLLAVLSALAFAHLDMDNLGHINLPGLGEGSFDPIVLGALIGVVLDIFAAHILVTIFGRTLLQRDPTGRSVVRGHAAGIGFAMSLNVVWVIAVSGAIPPATLAAEPSTVLVPLAAVAGPLVQPLGAVFVILSMGLGLIQFSLALFNLARERIGVAGPWGGPRARFVLALSPVVAVLLVAEWMVVTGSGSFTGILGFLGVMVHSLMSGIFPVLLLVASRRKGEIVPGVSYRLLGHPLLVGGIYLLFLGNLFLHGLWIWDEPVQQLGALLAGVVMLAVTAWMIHRGAFAPRAVIELRADRRRQGATSLSLTMAGTRADAAVQFRNGSGDWQPGALGEVSDAASLRAVRLDLPASPARELKVWAHAISADGAPEPLPVQVTIGGGGEPGREPSPGGGIEPLEGAGRRVEIRLA